MAWHRVPIVGIHDEQPAVVTTEVGGIPLVMVFGEGRWWAVEDRCSHAGCAFTSDGEIDGLIAVCNCHGSEFDVTNGQPVVVPATEAIRTFPVRLGPDGLMIEL